MRCLNLSFTLVAAMTLLPLPQASADSLDAAVDSYEHLAIVLVEVRKTEDAVVKTIITHHYQTALEHLKQAQTGDEKKHLEAAAEQITNIANEGDKRVLAIRQRLAKAGSTHLTDAVTKEDYLWIDSTEKKAMLGLAKTIASLESPGSAKLETIAKDLESAFDKAIAPEKR